MTVAIRKPKGRTAGIWCSDMTSVWVHKDISSSWTEGQTPREHHSLVKGSSCDSIGTKVPGICWMLWAAICCCHVLSKASQINSTLKRAKLSAFSSLNSGILPPASWNMSGSWKLFETQLIICRKVHAHTPKTIWPERVRVIITNQTTSQ